MMRLIVIMTGLLWASLLLISWSGPSDSTQVRPQPPETTQVLRP